MARGQPHIGKIGRLVPPHDIRVCAVELHGLPNELFTGFLGLLGLSIAGVAARTLRREWTLFRHGARVRALIIEGGPEPNGPRRRFTRAAEPVAEFTTAGGELVRAALGDPPAGYSPPLVGERVEIAYAEDRPEDVLNRQAFGSAAFQYVMMLAIGLAFAGVALAHFAFDTELGPAEISLWPVVIVAGIHLACFGHRRTRSRRAD